MAINIGDILEGKVTRITSFGAFVDLGGGQSGLVHISEVANAYVRDINEYLKSGDTVKVKVVGMESEHKIGLSIKQAAPAPAPAAPARPVVSSVPEPPAESGFEDKLARFMKDSNEKLVALKKHQEGKKGR